MRNFSFWLASTSLLMAGVPVMLPLVAQAGTVDGQRLSQTLNEGVNEGFYADAKRLIQEQRLLASRIREAMSGPDPNAIRAVDGQIVIHATQVNRFIGENYLIARPRCASASGAVGRTTGEGIAAIASQDAITCTLSQNAKTFEGLQPRLFARLNMLSGIAKVERLPLVSGEPTVTAGGIPGFEKGSLKDPAPSLQAQAPDIPAPEPRLLGRPLKSALGDYVPPIPPAITAPPAVLQVLDEIEARLDAAQGALPLRSQTFNPPQLSSAPTLIASAPSSADFNVYDVAPSDRTQYQAFLRQPHTGITQVLTRREFEPDPNQLRNRLAPTPGELHPYAILIEPTDPPLPDLSRELQGRLAPSDTLRYPFVSLEETSFRPRLAMQIDHEQFRLMTSGLDYGFMLDLGPIKPPDLNAISAGLPADQLNLRPDLREFFLNYRVPDKLEPLMADRRRFLSAKAGPNNLPTLLSPQSTVQVGHTYLLRTIQFAVPEAIAQGKPLSYGDRRNLDQTLAMPGKDLLVLFQPIDERSNGTSTVLWRVLGEFPVPQISDLDQYAVFQEGIVMGGIPGIQR